VLPGQIVLIQREIIGQYNFSNKKQIELLQTVNFIIYKKNYPEEISGIIDKKIELLKQEELKMAVGNTNLKLSSKKGAKVNFIRIIIRLVIVFVNSLNYLCCFV